MVVNYLKRIYKQRLFMNKANCGKGLFVGPHSMCISSNKNNITVSNNCEIHGVLYSYENGIITIGSNTFINSKSFIGAMESVSIGSHVIISTNVRIFDNNNHPTNPQMRWHMCESGFHNENWEWKTAEHKPVNIGDNVWIGEYSTVLKGVNIGKGSIIACHSVVVKDVPEYCIVAGNPARVVKYLKDDVNGKD